MSLRTRREYLTGVRERYAKARGRAEKSQIVDEVVRVLNYHRKYAVRALNDSRPPRAPAKRTRSLEYSEALPAVKSVWEALDYPCAERLHPVLLSTAELLSYHGELALTPEIRLQLAGVSQSTLARRLSKWRLLRPRCTVPHRKQGFLLSQVPIERYEWDESRPGAIEIDLVEHNGGSTFGHYAYSLSMVDVVTGYSRRRAVLGRGQAGVHRELAKVIHEWPYKVWGLHVDNGSEFLTDQLLRFCREKGLRFTRSRPYRKNDNAHVEQKNRQYVREVVGYDRFDTPEAVEWLNRVYESLDMYANLFLPMRKVVAKQRSGPHVSKKYDTACTPFQRLLRTGAVPQDVKERLERQAIELSPLAVHRRLEELLARGPSEAKPEIAAGAMDGING